ncbi:MAG: hypothetical protein C0475_05000 [Planctomyces sp.]|nr:hypothetical protein [Planctomyces sp.]MBA4120144.1 hypothetical protein [Isosphaera sp.]
MDGALGAATRSTGVDFQSILAGARSGQARSNRPVEVSERLGISLSDDQAERLSAAADRAQSAGASTALVLLDGLALRLDVTARRVDERLDNAERLRGGFDAIVSAPAPGATDEPTLVPVPGGGLTGNASLASLLARLARAAQTADTPARRAATSQDQAASVPDAA